ncbi:MAG: hypothetical protein CUN56_17225, partial [Phototrophicales bacterium]
MVIGGLAIDQACKRFFFEGEYHQLNDGVFLGWMGSNWWSVIVPIFLAYIYLEMKRSRDGLYRIVLALLLAGGVGNWLDRVFWGGVRDFIYYPVIG